MSGLERIAAAFAAARGAGRAALMPYCTLGFPTPEISPAVLRAIAASGADLIELGLPFSDPLADGPTIQHSTQAALKAGTTTGLGLEITAGLRREGVRQPLLLMGYYNPILACGVERFVAEAAGAGADGLIVPDLPPEEAGAAAAACRACGLALVFLLPPNAGAERMRLVASVSTGFLYLVSLTGVTGARRELPPDLAGFIRQVREATALPLAVGFGISNAAQARAVGELADGVIVGSALIDAIGRPGDPAQNAARFVRELKRGL